MQAALGEDRSATFSEDRVYRYALWRIWDLSLPPVLFIGLNPSTADETEDDPTIRRCIRFARDWGYGGLLMGNLFAFRATNPKDLSRAYDDLKISAISGYRPDSDYARFRKPSITDEHLLTMAKRAGLVVAAWGSHKVPALWDGRDVQVRELIPNLHCLGTTRDGHPKHPLYLKADTHPMPLPNLSVRSR